MKCPNCKSSAKSTGAPTLSDNKAILTESFTCECGCYFDTDYERNEEGAWEWYWTQIHFIDKEMIKQFEINT